MSRIAVTAVRGEFQAEQDLRSRGTRCTRIIGWAVGIAGRNHRNEFKFTDPVVLHPIISRIDSLWPGFLATTTNPLFRREASGRTWSTCGLQGLGLNGSHVAEIIVGPCRALIQIKPVENTWSLHSTEE